MEDSKSLRITHIGTEVLAEQNLTEGRWLQITCCTFRVRDNSEDSFNARAFFTASLVENST
jgi:hypothetical protein